MMPSNSSHKIGQNQSTESMLLHLLMRLEMAKQKSLQRQLKRFGSHQPISIATMRFEIRTFELWRSIVAECLASFLYIFLLCATSLTWNGSNFIFGSTPNWLIIALCSGFAMATLIQCFGHISGGHINPAVTIAFLITKRISPLRALMYILAHCAGAIAGAALLYGVTATGNQMHSMGPLGITIGHDSLNVWQIVTVEFLLTFLVVFTTFASNDPQRKSFGSDSLSIGIAYLVASLCGLPASGASMNPARSLGPAFVMNRWQYHWVYWAGPISGAIFAAIIYEFIFDARNSNPSKRMVSSLQSTLSSTQHKLANKQHYQSQTYRGKFLPDHFDFDLERDSNVDDDYEDPELTAVNKLPSSVGTKLFAANINTAGICSASAASSGSSSGHSRSNHTQHSIVSIHGNNTGAPQSSASFESYRPMIGPFGTQTNHLQEVSPQIYNEPTTGSNFYQSASEQSGQNSGGSNVTSTANANFFHSMHQDRNRGSFMPSGHSTMMTTNTHSATAQVLNRHLNQYDHQATMGSKY